MRKQSFASLGWLLFAAAVLLAFFIGRTTAPPVPYPWVVPIGEVMSLRLTQFAEGTAEPSRRVPVTEVYEIAFSANTRLAEPTDGLFIEDVLFQMEFSNRYFTDSGDCEGLLGTLRIGKTQLDYNGTLYELEQQWFEEFLAYLENRNDRLDCFALPAH